MVQIAWPMLDTNNLFKSFLAFSLLNIKAHRLLFEDIESSHQCDGRGKFFLSSSPTSLDFAASLPLFPPSAMTQ